MNSDLTFITNENGATLLDRFKALIKDTKHFDILVGYFYVTGFHQLVESLENTNKIRILIGIKTNRETFGLVEQAQMEQINFKSHTETKEEILNESCEELNNSQDTIDIENGVLKFKQWLVSKKMEIRACPEANLHAKVYILTFKEGDRDTGRVITGSSNFTKAGLIDNLEFNVELKNRADYDYAQEKFNELWKKSVEVTDVFVDAIENKSWLRANITPYELFLKFLYEYFREDLSYNIDLFYKNFPDGFKKLRYQEQAVINAKRILEKYNGVFLADVVGLGKTYTAAMLASQLPGRNLVIAPPTLINRDNPHSWTNVFHDFKLDIYPESIGQLEKIIERGTDRYENVFIDEAHRFRNELTQSYGILSQICKNKKVILISATPYNNSPKDILSQIKLFQNGKNSDIPGVKNLENFINNLVNKLKGLDRLKDYDEYMKIVEENASVIRNRILRHLMIRRTRNDIRTFFPMDLKKDDSSNSVEFPDIMKPEPLFYQLDEKLNKVFMNTLKMITDDKQFCYARYTPLLYLKEELREFDRTSQRNMGGFMKTLLVKRLESSFFAFKSSIERFIKSYDSFISAFNSGYVFVSKKYSAKVIELFLSGQVDKVEELIEEEKVEKWKSDSFDLKFLTFLEKDRQTLETIRQMWEDIDYDPKLEEFIFSLKNNPILKTSKLLVFTESIDTAEYLKEKLEKDFKNEVLLYHGDINKERLKTVLENFDPNYSTKSDTFRILITTDILAEGVNLHRSNVVVNYDIPWNPTKMIQRVGRINRVDTSFKQIFTFNFFPTEKSNEEIKLKEAAEAKIRAFIEMLGNDSALLTEAENVKSHQLWNQLNSQEFVNADDSEESDLKYLNIIKNVQKNEPDLFDKIKNLPKKARVARDLAKFNRDSNDNNLITYFRKGLIEKFFLSNSEETKELDFLEAAKVFEAMADEKPVKIDSKIFFELLDKNKYELMRSFAEDEEIASSRGRSKDYGVRISKTIRSKEFKAFKQFSEVDHDYIIRVNERIQDGAIPKRILKNIYDKIKDQTNPGNILTIIKEILPYDFLRTISESKNLNSIIKKEVVLSELFQSK